MLVFRLIFVLSLTTTLCSLRLYTSDTDKLVRKVYYLNNKYLYFMKLYLYQLYLV